MNRDDMLAHVQDESSWDFIIVGGGATGLGVAVDAASRGYKTLLLEMSDFAKATSSRSTKLVHGGVRYLQQGNISLVLEALKERGLLRQNAPHLVKDLSFVVPNYDWWEGPYYGIGMKLYDLLAGKYGFGRSKNLSREETLAHIPTVNPEGLVGGVIYHDGQFDDARLAINMAQTAVEQGATLLNYMKVTALTKRDGEVSGVLAHDLENDKEYEINARVVINAAGIFSDDIRQMDNPDTPGRMRPSQGIHIVLDRSYLPGDSAIMVPKTDDGRVLFAVPWHNVIIVGTTDTPVEGPSLEPKPLDEEIDFVLEHTQRYLRRNPTRDDLLSVFAGIRPLVSEGDSGDTSKISREHQISISPSGLLTIAGGKWTTYRNMAEDTVDQAILLSGLDEEPCVTKTLQLHGYHQHADEFGELALYGSDAPALRELMSKEDRYAERLHEDHPVKVGQVVWAARHEMARTVDDFLSRRTRMLLLDARASMEMAPTVAEIMADELDHDEAWQEEQVQTYRDLANDYLA
jgi:glycerol-3-phosphate dehydrogenase